MTDVQRLPSHSHSVPHQFEKHSGTVPNAPTTPPKSWARAFDGPVSAARRGHPESTQTTKETIIIRCWRR